MAEKKQFVILMVDSDENDWMLVKQALAEEQDRQDFDIDLRHLEDGVELLEYLDHCKSGEDPKGPMPNFILLDLNIPATGGRETLKKVISHRICRRIPIIVFATSADQADIIECYQCGGSSFGQYPNDYENVSRKVRAVVNHWLCAGQLPGTAPFECMGYG